MPLVHDIKDMSLKENSARRLGQCLQTRWSHRSFGREKLTEWKEWRGLRATTHLTSRCIVTCWHMTRPSSVESVSTVRKLGTTQRPCPRYLMPRRCPNTQKHKRAKRELNRPYLHLPAEAVTHHIPNAPASLCKKKLHGVWHQKENK